jgi:HlyD family secretion protein
MSIPQRRPRRSAAAKWTIRLMIVAVIGGALALLPRAFKKPPLQVRTVKVERSTVRDEVSSSTAGEVSPEKHATVRAELGARVVAVKKARGDRVKRGEVIVVLDAADLDARAQQASASVGAAEAQAAAARARVATVSLQAARAKALAEKGAGTAQLSEDAAALVLEASEAARAAKGALDQAQAAVRVARVARGKAELTAPFDGILTDVHPDPGDQLAPAAPVFQIMDDSRLHVDATIDESDIGKLKVGQPAELKLDAMPGKPVKGRLAKIAPAVQKDLKGARTLAVEVEVTDVETAKAAGLRAGMSCNVDILVAEKPDVVSLPTNTVIGRGAKRTVFRIENGIAKSREVEVGLSNWDRSEIVSGVAVGDLVVANLNMKELVDGVAVSSGSGH